MADRSDFIEQFRELFLASPQCGSWTRNSENCDYGDIVTLSKDCYMCFNCGNSRDAYYSEDGRALKDSVDCAFCEDCELCYECIDCNNCYSSNFCQDCSNCRDVYFSYNLRRCNNCFGCSTLRDKQFCIFNEQYSKEEYEEKIKQFDVSNKAMINFVAQKLEELKLKTPRMYVHEHDTTDCTGDYVYHSKNCHRCFDTRHSEDSFYIYLANLESGAKDCFDCGPIATSMELSYDCAYPDYCFECKHLYWCSRLKNCEWCCNCIEGNYLFGCHYLKNRSDGYYILNQKVEKDFYFAKTKEINEELFNKGIFTLYDLLTKEPDNAQTKITNTLEDRKCLVCNKPFDLYKKEVEFYKKYEIPFPVYCPDCRVDQRYKLRNPRELYKRKCDSCKNTLISTYPPDSKHIVYCLKCWWKHLV